MKTFIEARWDLGGERGRGEWGFGHQADRMADKGVVPNAGSSACALMLGHFAWLFLSH